MSLPFRIFLLVCALTLFCGVDFAQTSADNKSIKLNSTDPDDDDHPKSIQESLEKMRIEKDKKEHEEMVGRGAEAMKLAEELQKSFTDNGKLTNADLVKVARVEKIVKKVRDELGGNDDDDPQTPMERVGGSSLLTNAIDSLKDGADNLFAELKKTTRFTISATAIIRSNTLLRLVKILRFGR